MTEETTPETASELKAQKTKKSAPNVETTTLPTPPTSLGPTIAEVASSLGKTTGDIKRSLGLHINTANETTLTPAQVISVKNGVIVTSTAQQPRSFLDSMKAVSDLIVSQPMCATMELKKNPDTNRSYYEWMDNTPEATETRLKIREILEEVWQSGAYNYATISTSLRLTELDVQALIDEQFRRRERIAP